MEVTTLYKTETVSDSFDYSSLENGDRIQSAAAEIKSLVKKTAAYIWETGKLLSEIRELVPKKKWGAWLSAEFNWSERTARNYLSVFEAFKDSDIVDFNGSVRALYLLSSPDTPELVREKAIKASRNGKNVTPTVVEQLKSLVPVEGDYVLTCRGTWAKVLLTTGVSVKVAYENNQEEVLTIDSANIKEILAIPESEWFSGKRDYDDQILSSLSLGEALGVVLGDDGEIMGAGIFCQEEKVYAFPPFKFLPQDFSWWEGQIQKYWAEHRDDLLLTEEEEEEEQEAPPPRSTRSKPIDQPSTFAKGDVCRTEAGAGRVLSVDKQGKALVTLDNGTPPIKLPVSSLKKVLPTKEEVYQEALIHLSHDFPFNQAISALAEKGNYSFSMQREGFTLSVTFSVS